jgi:hypothetical protein
MSMAENLTNNVRVHGQSVTLSSRTSPVPDADGNIDYSSADSTIKAMVTSPTAGTMQHFNLTDLGVETKDAKVLLCEGSVTINHQDEVTINSVVYIITKIREIRGTNSDLMGYEVLAVKKYVSK